MEHTGTTEKIMNDEKHGSPESPSPVGRKAESAALYAGHKVEDGASYVGHKAGEAASYVGRKVEDAASYVGVKAVDTASYVGHKASDAATYVGRTTGDASASLGSGLRSLGETVRERGPEGAPTTAVADTLESSGRYLQEEGVKDMAEDVTNLIRRNPIPALLIAVAAGYLVGRATSQRS